MSKPIKRVDLSQLTLEQRAALGQLYKDAQAAAPQLEEFKKVVATLFTELLRAPQWSIIDAAGEPPAQGWHIGAPTINDYREKR